MHEEDFDEDEVDEAVEVIDTRKKKPLVGFKPGNEKDA